MGDYSTYHLSKKLLREIEEALKNLDFGSVELYVQNGEVVQITRRHIKKTNNLTKG
ncbi:YezD family protein [Candidatus Gottesmanbacteria bacterium]|nr:YezD family protein [Candidatus Gottesmanbacteria bacterium]